MPTASDDLQNLLLDLISTHHDVDSERMSALSAGQWDGLLSMVQKHRLAPLLHWQCTHGRTNLAVPKDVRTVLIESFRKAAWRALVMQRELLLLVRILNKAGLPCIALKGAYLAYAVYPHAALRPMRDLDVLVAKNKALDAYQVLIDAGYAPLFPDDPRPLIASTKHPSPLRSPSGKVLVELHVRLIDVNDQRTTVASESGLWDRSVKRQVAGELVSYLSPTDLLLHLVFHAVYDHKFSNGPLALSDLSYLIRESQIDWPLFWQLADEGGWTRGCVLLLRMAQSYYGELPIDFPGPASSMPAGVDALAATCSALMLCDADSRYATRLASDLAGKRLHQKLSVLLKRVFQQKDREGVSKSVDDYSTGAYIGWQWVRIRRFFSISAPQFLANRGKYSFNTDVQKMAELTRWLASR